MRNLILLLILSFTPPALAGGYIDQGTHIRTLLFEGWSGSYLESTFVAPLGTVRFDFCQRGSSGPSQFKECRRLHKPIVLIRNLEFYEPHLLRRLEQLRERLAADLDSHLISRLLGGSQNDSNILVLDGLIQEIREESLSNWLRLKEPFRETPSVSSLKISSQVADVFQKVFELKPPQRPTPRPADEPGVLVGFGNLHY